MNNYNDIIKLIEGGFFDCIEDAIDLIQENYRSGKISLDERNELINLL